MSSDEEDTALNCQKDMLFSGEFLYSDFMTFVTYLSYYYYQVHIYLLVFFTVLDFFSNILMVVVLSQPELRSSGINIMMIMIAICNFLSILLTLVQNILELVNGYYKSFGQAVYGWVELYLNMFFPAMANCLVVQMAFCRVMSLFSTRGEKWNGRNRSVSIAMVLGVFVGLSSSVVIPMITVEWDDLAERYITTLSKFSLKNECLLLRGILFFVGFSFVFLPCILIFVFFNLILWKIKQSRTLRTKMLGLRNVQAMDRSSRLLQVVLVLFLVTKTPEALTAMFSAFYFLDFQLVVAPLTSDLIDMLSIANASTSFIIYCCMSSVFRSVFLRMFVPETLRRKLEKSRGVQITVVASTKNVL